MYNLFTSNSHHGMATNLGEQMKFISKLSDTYWIEPYKYNKTIDVFVYNNQPFLSLVSHICGTIKHHEVDVLHSTQLLHLESGQRTPAFPPNTGGILNRNIARQLNLWYLPRLLLIHIRSLRYKKLNDGRQAGGVICYVQQDLYRSLF